MAEHGKWQIYVARAETLGGRSLRRQLILNGDMYKVLEEAGDWQQEMEKKGLLLPFLDANKESLNDLLPQVDMLLERARFFRRTVLILGEPLPEVLQLLGKYQAQGIACTAVCAAKGELYGGERKGEISGPVEEAMDLLADRLKSSSPRKRVLLPYRQEMILNLLYVDELSAAAIFALQRYDGTDFLLVMGQPCSYGEMALLAGKAAGFEGRFQFGKERLKAEAIPAGLRTLKAGHHYNLAEVLPSLYCRRQRQGKITLSACVIMRDSEADIGRCLESLSAADEIIVVDTGSVDRSVEIARKYTDKVYHFDWINDFAAAKNYALDKATGDWIVFPDSDEFFTKETAPKLHRLAEDYDDPGKPGMLFVHRKEYDRNLRPLGSEMTVVRLFSRELRFFGVVHEILMAPGKDEIREIYVSREDCQMMHTGYDSSRVAAKLERNAEILRQAHEAGNDIPLQHYNLGKILIVQGKYEEARQEMIMARNDRMQPANCRAAIYRTWHKASCELGDEKAMSEAMVAMRQDMPTMPDSYLMEGRKLWQKGQKDEAAPLLLKALELSHDFLRLNPGEINDIAGDMPALAEELASFWEKRGERDLAAKIRGLA